MKRTIRKFARKFGFDIIKFNKNQMGLYPFYDMSKFIVSKHPVLFDVGANVGQTVKDFKEVFKNATIHAFEPSPDTFKILNDHTPKDPDLHLWNYGMGSSEGELILNEYTHSNTNSFLNMHENNPESLQKTTNVQVVTVDQFCADHNINYIDVLKIDTEGFELEVFKGADNMFDMQKIGLLFFEVRFTENTNGTPSFVELWSYAMKKDFELVSIYPLVHRKNMGAYTNVLFKHKTF